MAISPEKHMMLLKRAWHEGIDKAATKSFVLKHMNGTLQAARIIKNDEYVKGYEAAMKLVEELLDCTETFEEFAQIMEVKDA